MWYVLSMVVLWGLTGPMRTYAAGNVQVIQTPNGGIVPDAEVDGRGVIHLAYVSGEDVYYVKSSDRGKSFSPPIRVNTEAGTAYGGAYRGPDIAVDRERQIHVIWYTNGYQRKLPVDQWGVFYTHMDASKRGFVPARNLNRKPSDNYSLAADGKGKVAVFWMAGHVYFQRSDDGGETFSGAVVVDQADPCECCASRAYFSVDGRLYFSYRDKAENMRDMYL
ncbi:MAG: exo-alpha-sialidase, partial [Candidatus Latescibacteria bacterium]|nr:exo-alpha-sialidase [Candidatus Latescibacterota bacterium]